MDPRIDELKALLKAEGLNAPPYFAEKLLHFERLLLETNRVMNLTAITEPWDMMKKHYWDSIYPLSQGWIGRGQRIIDVGCGAGFPSLPLKLMEPSLDFTLMDSLEKRLRFLNRVIAELQLEKIQTCHQRAEAAGKDPLYRERYDIAVSRAVAELPKLCEYCLPLIRPGGALIAYKGAGAQEELSRAQSAVYKLGGKAEQLLQYTLPGEEDRRALILIRKERPTPKQYPRQQKQIKENPL